MNLLSLLVGCSGRFLAIFISFKFRVDLGKSILNIFWFIWLFKYHKKIPINRLKTYKFDEIRFFLTFHL